MNIIETLENLAPHGMTSPEWKARLELAACYRIFDHFGWSEAIFNHISLRVDGANEAAYLINPYGLHYGEVTARNLVKIDVHGETLDASPHPVNRAGFVIHSAIHAARADAHCVVHTHTDSGMAVACKQDGLRHDNFYSASLSGQVAYHDFEGITTDIGEQSRLVASMGDKRYLILRNHGLLAVGSHVPETLMRYWVIQRACDIQARTDAMHGSNVSIPEHVLQNIPQQARPMHVGSVRRGQMFFDAMLRKTGVGAEELAG